MGQIKMSPCRFSSRKNYHRKLCNDSPDHNQTDNFESKPIPIEEFEDYVSTMHRNNNLGFNRLLQTIEESTKSTVYPTKFSQTGHNKSKNRYKDILPCMNFELQLNEHVRNFQMTIPVLNYPRMNISMRVISMQVYLRDLQEKIRLFFVQGCEKINAYIATQGPMMNTIDDFW